MNFARNNECDTVQDRLDLINENKTTLNSTRCQSMLDSRLSVDLKNSSVKQSNTTGSSEAHADSRGKDSGVVSPSSPVPLYKDDSSPKTKTTMNKYVEEKKIDGRQTTDSNGGQTLAENILEAPDSGQGSDVAEDFTILAYHFYIQTYLCGILIGNRGSNVHRLRELSRCDIKLRLMNDSGDQKSRKPEDKNELQVCMIHGTRQGIDICLDLIRERFPASRYPEFSLEQKNSPTSFDQSCGLSQLEFAPGIGHEVIVSAIITGGHLFIQQPNHPTFHALPRLNDCLLNCYNEIPAPQMPSPVVPNSVCVARAGLHDCQWYRVLVLSHDEYTDLYEVQFLDYGSYAKLAWSDLRQIRSDFLSLPFQALECMLANVLPLSENSGEGEWSFESAVFLENIVTQKILTCRIVGSSDLGIPLVHLYLNEMFAGAASKLVNRELVDRGYAVWFEYAKRSTGVRVNNNKT